MARLYCLEASRYQVRILETQDLKMQCFQFPTREIRNAGAGQLPPLVLTEKPSWPLNLGLVHQSVLEANNVGSFQTDQKDFDNLAIYITQSEAFSTERSLLFLSD